MNTVWRIMTYPFRAGPRRPLAMRRPDRHDMGQTHSTPLGMEATDLSLVERVNRRNDALERTSMVHTRKNKGLFTAAASTRVDPMPEDETYAARYHRAYIKKDT